MNAHPTACLNRQIRSLEFEEQLDYFCRRPPSCIAAFLKRGPGELELGPGGHGEKIAIGFSLACECGSDTFAVSAFRWQRDQDTPSALINPLTAICSGCQKERLVFDGRVHGYDAVACEDQSEANGLQEETAVAENISELSDPRTLDAVFYYPDDLFDECSDDFSDRREDLFSWVRFVIGRSAPERVVVGFECA